MRIWGAVMSFAMGVRIVFPQRTIGLIGKASTAAAALHSLPILHCLFRLEQFAEGESARRVLVN
jgi:hypothetical protein